MNRNSIFNKYSYLWITLAFFIFSVIGHWVFSWKTYVEEQQEHNQEIEMQGFVDKTLGETFENWQSEFLQLMWQVGGLAMFLYVGSTQSKEGDERKEEKIDLIIQKLDPKNGDKQIKEIDGKYFK